MVVIPIILNQYTHSPLNLYISYEEFLFMQLMQLDIFSFATILCKQERWLCVKIPVKQQCLKSSEQPFWHKNNAMFELI